MTRIICPECDRPYDGELAYCEHCGARNEFLYFNPKNANASLSLTLSIGTAVVLDLALGLANKSHKTSPVIFFTLVAIVLSCAAIYLASLGIKEANERRIYGRGLSISAIIVSLIVILKSSVISLVYLMNV